MGSEAIVLASVQFAKPHDTMHARLSLWLDRMRGRLNIRTLLLNVTIYAIQTESDNGAVQHEMQFAF